MIQAIQPAEQPKYTSDEEELAYLQSTNQIKEAPQEEELPNLIPASFRDSFIHSGFDFLERTEANKIDPEFIGDTRVKAIKEARATLPLEMWHTLDDAGSQNELNELTLVAKKDMQAMKAISDAGAFGTATHFMVNMFDVDTLFAFTAMGKAFGAAVRGAEATTFSGQVLKGAKIGTIAGTGFGTGEYITDPKGTPVHVLGGAMYGAMFGTGIGVLAGGASTNSRSLINSSLEKTIKNYPEHVKDSSFGTEKLDTPSIDDTSVFSASPADMIGAAANAVQRIAPTRTASVIADSVKGVIDKVPFLKTDYVRLWDSPSNLSKYTTYQLLEDASGTHVNNRSGAMLKEVYEKRLLSSVMLPFNTNYNSYIKGRANRLTGMFSQELHKEFSESVLLELNNRMHERPGTPGVHPSVLALADEIDKGTAEAVGILKGKGGEQSVDGFAELEPKSGYFRLQWSGPKMVQSIAAHGEDKVKAVLKAAYKEVNPKYSDEVLDMLTSAVVRRTKGKALDVDHEYHSFLDQDLRAYTRDMLIDHGVPENKVDGLINQLHPEPEERGKAGYAKHRTPIDLSITDSNGLRVLDLIDTDVPRLWSLYSRDAAGRSALARKGLTNRAQVTDLITQIVKEDNEAGGTLTRDYLKDVFTFFEAGPIGGGVSDPVRRIKQLTTLSLLNKLGVPQLAETGVGVAAVGVEAYTKHSKILADILTDAKSGKVHPLAKDLQWMTGELWNDHLLNRVDLGLDETRTAAASNNKTVRMMDVLLKKGMHLQGYASGFFAIKSAQSKILLMSSVDKTLQAIKKGDQSYVRRMESMGFTPALISRIKEKYIDTGVVEFGPDGFVNKMNSKDWLFRDAEDFALAMTRHLHSIVQQALPGETAMMWHKDLGALLTQFKVFPLVAAQKQFVRNLRLGDGSGTMMFTYGLGTAALAHVIRQATAGKTDQLDSVSIARGAFNMSNMSGWIPAWTDPLLYMMHMDDSMLNASYGREAGFGIPALSVANRLAFGVPRALVPDGKFTKSDKYALEALPLVGNYYGMGYIFNSLLTDTKDK